MRRIIFFLLVISFGASAQDKPSYFIGLPGQTAHARGNLRVDSVFLNALKDTTFTPWRVGLQVFRPADSSLYVSTSITAANKWTKLGSAVAGSAWGTITGTLSSQTDLAAALAAKQDLITPGTTADYIRGDFSLSNFSSDVTGIADALYSALGHSHDGLAPIGGLTGYILKKNSNTDYDYSWQPESGGGGSSSGNPDSLGGEPAAYYLNLTNHTGTLPVNKGGTGATTLTGVLIGNGTSAFTGVTGTASQLLRRNAGNTAYEFFTPTYILPSDTASMLTNYLRKIDTANKWVNTITKNAGGDSIVFFIGGTRYAIADRGSSGALTLQQTFNTEVGGSVLTKTDTVDGASSYGLHLLNLGSFGVRIAGTTSNGLLINTSSIGASINSPVLPLIATTSNTSTNTVEEALRLVRNPGVAGAAGIGTKITFQTKNTANSLEETGYFEHIGTNPVNSSWVTQYNIKGAINSSINTFMNIQDAGIVRVNNNADTLATKAYARSLGGSGSGSGLNIYNTDSSLSGDRTVNGNNKFLHIDSTLNWQIGTKKSGLRYSETYNTYNTAAWYTYYDSKELSGVKSINASNNSRTIIESQGAADASLSRIIVYPDSISLSAPAYKLNSLPTKSLVSTDSILVADINGKVYNVPQSALTIAASQITSGLIAPARLGTGSVGDGSTVLADDNTWKTAIEYNFTAPADGDIITYSSGNLINTPASTFATQSALDDSAAAIRAAFPAGGGVGTYPGTGNYPYSTSNAWINTLTGVMQFWYLNTDGDTVVVTNAVAQRDTFPTAASTYFTEDFTGTNGVDIQGTTTETGGFTWTASGGNTGQQFFDGAGNVHGNSTGVQSKDYISVGHREIDLRCTVDAIAGTSPNPIMMIAYTNDNNFIQVGIHDGNVAETVSGSYNALYGGSGTSVNGDIMRVTLIGNTLKVYRNATLLTTVTVNAANTGTKVGLYFYQDNASKVSYMEGMAP